MRAAWKNQRERIEQVETFINRFRYQATKAKQVQSRIKELERLERVEEPPPEERPSTSRSRSRNKAGASWLNLRTSRSHTATSMSSVMSRSPSSAATALPWSVTTAPVSRL